MYTVGGNTVATNLATKSLVLGTFAGMYAALACTSHVQKAHRPDLRRLYLFIILEMQINLGEGNFYPRIPELFLNFKA